MIDLLLIRHGMTKANQEHRYIGRTDLPLCREGRKLLREYREQGRYTAVQAVFSSPLTRCAETSRILYPHLAPVFLPELRESDFGDWENRSFSDLEEEPAFIAWLNSGGSQAPPNGESRQALAARCKSAMEQICRAMEQQCLASAAVVTHGGCIMAILSEYTGSPVDFHHWWCENGDGYRCHMDTQWMHVKNLKKLSEGILP